MLKDLVKKCRSYRRFYEDTPISREELEEMVDTARLTASTANSQALKYRLVDSPEECDRLFPCHGNGLRRLYDRQLQAQRDPLHSPVRTEKILRRPCFGPRKA